MRRLAAPILENSLSLSRLPVSLAETTQPKALEAATAAGSPEWSHLLTVPTAGAQRLDPIPWIPCMRACHSFIGLGR